MQDTALEKRLSWSNIGHYCRESPEYGCNCDIGAMHEIIVQKRAVEVLKGIPDSSFYIGEPS